MPLTSHKINGVFLLAEALSASGGLLLNFGPTASEKDTTTGVRGLHFFSLTASNKGSN